MDAAYLFAKNFVNTKYENLPADVVDATKKEILDLLGVALGGANQPGATHVCALVKEWGGKEESSIIGSKQKVPAPNAAQANATMAHALDFDDVHEAAVMHPGIASIPVVMAVGEAQGHLSGKELITSTALGVDMMCRLALATTPGKSPIELGWHLTSLFGFMGSAATAARVMGLDEETIVNAIGIGYHQCAGNGQCVKDGALTKRLGPGFAVKGGITAALLAKAGVTGAKNSFEGEWGLYQQYMHGDYSREILTADLGKRFEGVNVAIKPYPCCRGIHPAIDAGLALAIGREYPQRRYQGNRSFRHRCAPFFALPAVGREAIPAKSRGCPVQHSVGRCVGNRGAACGIGRFYGKRHQEPRSPGSHSEDAGGSGQHAAQAWPGANAGEGNNKGWKDFCKGS